MFVNDVDETPAEPFPTFPYRPYSTVVHPAKGAFMKTLITLLMVLLPTVTLAAERTVLWEYFTQTG